MVSATEVGGSKTPDSKANWNKNKPKPGNQVTKFGCAATSDNVLHGKVIITGSNQGGQMITLVKPFLATLASIIMLTGLKAFAA